MGAQATRVDRWWGSALNAYRKSGERTTEEIDVVGSVRKRVTVIGEVRWTAKPVGEGLLRDLRTYKIPALQQGGLKLASEPAIVLFSRSGYTPGLRERARGDEALVLVDAAEMFSGQLPGG